MLIASAGAASPVLADTWSWSAGNGLWSNPANWSPNSVPGNLPGEEIVRIGNLPGVSNSTVLLDVALTPPTFLTINELHLSSAMTLDTNGDGLNMYGQSGDGTTTLHDPNTRLLVRPTSDASYQYDLFTQALTMGVGTQLQLVDDAEVLLGDTTSSGLISGRGTIRYASLFRNDGTISGTNNGGLTLELSSGFSSLDLDGATGNGQLSMASPFSQITILGNHLTDSFSGTVTMGSGSLLTMNLADGWTADAASTFNVASSIVGAAAQIAGGHLTFGGDLNIGGTQGHLRILADTTLAPTADVFLGNDDRLELDGQTVISGGIYNLSQGARIDFDGSTEVAGGTFNMVGDLATQGVVNFNGGTTWTGSATFNGLARQVGDAVAIAPLTLNAAVFDMDGNGDTIWTISHRMTVNTNAIDTGSQQFDGILTIMHGAVGRLTLNLADPTAAWTMNGTMHLGGLGILTTTRVVGSDMIFTGDLNMFSGIAQITANTTFQDAQVRFLESGTLRMRGGTIVDAGTTFLGMGTLENGIGGSMLLNTGTSLAQVALANSGILRIGENGPGIAAVDRFTSTEDAIWAVEIAGEAPGAEHDLLLITGGIATLAGLLDVSLDALGGGTTFAPSIGDEFTILIALGGVSGTFSNNPITHVDALTYNWTIIYNQNTVVLRLESIVPAPGSMALLGLSGLIATRRRREAPHPVQQHRPLGGPGWSVEPSGTSQAHHHKPRP
jgi:hypothetical protein